MNAIARWTLLGIFAAACAAAGRAARADGPLWVDYPGKEGPGKGKKIVLISGDDEYRSEESLPQLAKILSVHHGFHCVQLFAVNKAGEIDPGTQDNIPGLEALADADLAILFLRYRELPDDQMKLIMDYVNSGRPLIGMRTATHAFKYNRRKDSPYAKFDADSKDPRGGFGRSVLGETWISHYGNHQHESTRGIPAPGMEKSPILRGCEDIWGPSDVYGVTTLEGDSQPLVLGEVLTGMNPTDPEKQGAKRLPVAWTKTYTGAQGKAAKVFTTTMGHGGDLQSEGFRRMLVNACYWCLGMESQIPERAKVDLVGEYKPNPIGFGGHKKGVHPADHALK